jgi:Right handed beta helix region
MDYYLTIVGNNNTVENSYVERVGKLDHGGHGLCMKGDCVNNTFKNCIATNTVYEVRHRGVQNNLIEDCTVSGDGQFEVRDGASYNTFNRCRAYNVNYGAVIFL